MFFPQTLRRLVTKQISPLPVKDPVTAYIANFKRPQNTERIVRSLLASESVGRVIVSNNNPSSSLKDYFSLSSDRLIIHEHAEPQSAAMRFRHLREYPSLYYLMIDDDLFLSPVQIDQLVAALHTDPSVPHGLYGQRWMGDRFQGGVQQIEGEIDVISRAYAFTSVHLQEFFRIAAMRGYDDESPAWKTSRWDDILLSHTGSRRPQIHDAGPLLDCPTQGTPGIATWREEGFHEEREEVFQSLLASQLELYFPYGHDAFLQSMLEWHEQALSSEKIETGISERFTVILQSFKRPWNMQMMIRLLLRFDCIERVILSNNNPEIDLDQWVFIDDPRLTIVQQPVVRPASMMGMLAFEEAKKGAQNFLVIDDDLFLFPHQIEKMMRGLIDDVSVPHGLIGQQIRDGRGVACYAPTEVRHHVTGDGDIDILNRVYAFTADHILRYADILDHIGYTTDAAKMMLPYGSDIVLSHTGNGKPRIHEAGPFLSCPTNEMSGIAKFKEVGFENFRADLWQRVGAQHAAPVH